MEQILYTIVMPVFADNSDDNEIAFVEHLRSPQHLVTAY